MTVPKPAGMFSAYQVRRYAAGSYVSGVWTPGAETLVDIIASVQPARGDELLSLEEGQRVKGVMKVYTDDELQTANEADGTPADMLIYDGEDWEVQDVSHHAENALAHYKALAVRKDRA